MGTVLTLKSMLSRRNTMSNKSRGKIDGSHRVEGRSKRKSPQKRPGDQEGVPNGGHEAVGEGSIGEPLQETTLTHA
jgi:hypothetical protein